MLYKYNLDCIQTGVYKVAVVTGGLILVSQLKRVTRIPAAAICALLFLLTATAWGQVATGTISGTVDDKSGGILPGAKVVVVNEETGITRNLDTDQHGRYTAPGLSVGPYRVTATVDGFQTEVRTGIVLTVAREAVVDFSLAVGSVSEKVEVTGGAPLVETTTASLGSLVDGRSIRSLPLNGRSWDQLALIQPGVTVASPGAVTGNQFNYGTGKRFSVGGQRQTSNLFLMDGTDVNDAANSTPGGASGTNLGMETIEEFKVFTNSYKAEYGHSMGSIITAVTRSGTNKYRGTVFEYIRNSAVDARNYFDTTSSPPSFRRNQFGGVLGGPIKKDKLFFFIGYEGLRQGLGTTQISTVPTAQARLGVLPTGNVTVNPTVKPYLALYPLPNGRDFGDGSAQFSYAPTVITNQDNGMGRVDYQINAKNSIFGRYMTDRDEIVAPQVFPNEISTAGSRRQYNTLQWNSVLSDSTLNNFHFAYNRTASLSDFEYTTDVSALTFVAGQTLGTIQLGAVGAAGSRALTMLGNTLGAGPSLSAFNLFEWGDDWTHTAGRHSFKAGVNIQRMGENVQVNGTLRGAYTFSSFPNFLQGIPSNFQIASPIGTPFHADLHQTLMAGYVQDDLKVSSRLSLNLGLRWEAPTNPMDTGGKNSQLSSPAATSLTLTSGFANVQKKNFEPRFGLAWELTQSGKTVLRAGAGIYHNQILPYYYHNLAKNPPFAGLFSATNPPFPNGVSLFTGLTPGSSTGLTNIFVLAPFQKTPTSYQYNVSIQQELWQNTVAQVAYAGNGARHLLTEIEADTPVPTICSSTAANCPAGIPDGTTYYPAGVKRRNTAWNGIRWYQSNGDSAYNSVSFSIRHQSPKGFQGQIFYTYAKAMDDSSNVSPGESLRSPQSAMNPENPKADWALSDFSAKHVVVGNLSYALPFHPHSRALDMAAGGWTVNAITSFSSGLPFTALLATNNSRNQTTAGQADRPNLKPGSTNNPTKGVSAGCAGFLAGTKVGTPTNWYDPCAFTLPTAGTYGNLGRNTLIGPGLQDIDLGLEKTFRIHDFASTTFRAESFNLFNHTNFGLPNTSAFAASGAANPSAGVITQTVTSSRQFQLALRINF